MQYLAEPTAATLKGCGYALQPKPRENKKNKTFQRMFGLKLMYSFVFSQFIFVVLTSKKQKMRLDFFKGCIASVHILYFSARILLLILRGYLVFKAITLF